MTQLTKIQILDKMKEFSKELGVLVDNAKRTKKWLDMAVCTEPVSYTHLTLPTKG